MSKGTRWLLLIIPILFISCGRKFHIPLFNSTPKTNLEIEEIDFEYFHGKAKMTLKDGNKEREVKANVRVRKDSVIWMDIQVVGISGARVLINQDSITIRSNVEKEYYVFEYAELSKRFNFEINYNIIQAAFLGNLVMQRKETDEIGKEISHFVLKQHAGTVDVVNLINAASMKIEKVELKEASTENILTINYSNFQSVADKTFPYNGVINLVYKTSKGLLNTNITFEYNKAEVGDKELKFPFNIPKKYDRR
ncbi:MAG: DUF4292 domain-containing protein [Flammeovirgaceae bacterium]|nr:DUF4292 domain-containing protein [Flammeovirgaceae bacterium]